ncbi:MAG: hypothetical protein QOE36_2533 [Gaiellaceae bacterium]|nr:hypothetical protein [Gaiellaceae bacterium]
MNRLRTWLIGTLFVVAPAAALAAPTVAGSWQRLPAAPIPVDSGRTSVWTGKEMLVVGRVTTLENGAAVKRVGVGAAYDPAARTWRRLPDLGDTASFMDQSSVWTGKEMLVWGQGTREAYNPATNQWRRLPNSPLLSIHDGFGLVAWTGRDLIGWGGGCCGDAFSDGVAYRPATNRWRKIARAPLNGSQSPVGAWTGHELIVLVGSLDPDGKPLEGARAAAYNPTTNRWRQIAPLPSTPGGANAVWDGRELLVVGGDPSPSALPRDAYAYNPGTNRWRRLPQMPSGRTGADAVWTGKRLLLWGGQTGRAGALVTASRGLAFDPKANRWSRLPQAPLTGRVDPTAVWTGRALLVWGGDSGNGKKHFTDGAAFRPAAL